MTFINFIDFMDPLTGHLHSLSLALALTLALTLTLTLALALALTLALSLAAHRGMSLVMTPPTVSIPRESGFTSNKTKFPVSSSPVCQYQYTQCTHAVDQTFFSLQKKPQLFLSFRIRTPAGNMNPAAARKVPERTPAWTAAP